MQLINGMPEGKYADLPNGQRMHYQDIGSGPVVLFLHGSGSGASGNSNFKENYPFLVDQGYRVIVPDHVGYGYSSKPENVDYHLDFFVECIKQMMDVIGIEKASLVGNSLGGAIAIKYALDYPDAVEKLLLMAPGGIENQPDYFHVPGMALMKKVFTSDEPMTADKMRTFITEALVYDASCVDDQLIQERFESAKTQNPRVVQTMVVPNMEERLQELNCPVLVFWGINENMMPETGIMKLAKNIKDVRVVLVSQCGHWVMLEHKHMFNRNTLDFLKNG